MWDNALGELKGCPRVSQTKKKRYAHPRSARRTIITNGLRWIVDSSMIKKEAHGGLLSILEKIKSLRASQFYVVDIGPNSTVDGYLTVQ